MDCILGNVSPYDLLLPRHLSPVAIFVVCTSVIVIKVLKACLMFKFVVCICTEVLVAYLEFMSVLCTSAYIYIYVVMFDFGICGLYLYRNIICQLKNLHTALNCDIQWPAAFAIR